MQIVSNGDNCMKYQILFTGKNNIHITFSLSAELAHSGKG